MAAKVVKKATTNLTCPICYQLFKNPKYLPCYHSYCEKCLEKMVVRSKITCPECRQKVTVPVGGVKKLTNNFFISRMVDELVLQRKVEGEEEVKCDKCDEDKPVVSYCPDCNVFLCNHCNDNHKRYRRFHPHCIIPLTEMRSKKDTVAKNVELPICKEHNEKLQYYCETCEQLVCLYCTVKDHIGHNHDTAKKMAGRYRQKLKEIIAPFEEMVTEAHVKMSNMRMKIIQQGNEAIEQIDQHYDELVQQLLEQKEQLKQQVLDTVLQKEIAMTAQIEQVEYVKAKVLSLAELKDVVEKSSDQEALSAKKEVLDCVQQLSDEYTELLTQRVESSIMQFMPRRQPFPQFGQVNYTAVSFLLQSMLSKISLDYLVIPSCCIENIPNNDDCKMGKPWGIALCNNGMWAVADNSKHCVYMFDSQNRFIKKIGRSGNKGGEFFCPDVITFDEENFLYVVDHMNCRIQKFNSRGIFILKFGSSKNLHSPCGITVHESQVYVADYNAGHIVVFQKNGFFGKIIGKKHFKTPYDVAVSRKNELLVADSGHRCIFTVTISGDYVSRFEIGSANSFPRCLAVGIHGFFVVSDSAQHCVSIFDKEGKLIYRFGSEGKEKGQFQSPYGVAISHSGQIYVADHHNCRIQIFDNIIEAVQK